MKVRLIIVIINHSTEYGESTLPEGEVKKSAARAALSSITEFTGRP